MYKVYGDINSGNCYKVKLTLNHLGIEHDWVHIDILKGESRNAQFLALNPNGRIPVLIDADGRTLCESNAIVCFLADGTSLWPADRFERARVLQWQFFEQYSHEPYIATSRYIVRYLNSPIDRREELESKRAGGIAALRVMESHLQGRDYFVGDGFTVADISLYAYTHCAADGGFTLGEFANVSGWLDRVAGLAGHVTMEQFAP